MSTPLPTPPTQDVCVPLLGCLTITGDVTTGALIIIGMLGAAIVGGIIYIRRFKRTGGAILHEVKNDHTSNMRGDIDNLNHGISAVLDALKAIRADIGGIRGDIRQIQHDASDDRERLARHLEDTESRRRGE